MIVLKAFYNDPSTQCVINHYVYDVMVPKMASSMSRPSQKTYENICNFMSWVIEHCHSGCAISVEDLIPLLDEYLPGLQDCLSNAPITHIEPQANEFPYEEFTLGKYLEIDEKAMT